jgi:hypothetical protein
MLIAWDDYVAMYEDEDERITPAELHKHIQASIFGRPSERAQRFDDLQWKLHELVDRYANDKKIPHCDTCRCPAADSVTGSQLPEAAERD